MAADLAKVDAVGDVVRGWAFCDQFEMKHKEARAAEMIAGLTGSTKRRAEMLAQPLVAFLERTNGGSSIAAAPQIRRQHRRAA